MKPLTKPVVIETLRDLLVFLENLEEHWESDPELNDYMGELLDQTLHGEVFEQEDNGFKFKGIGKGIIASYDPCHGILLLAKENFSEAIQEG